MKAPARRLTKIHADVIDVRASLRRRGIEEETLDLIWDLTNEAFRRGCEWIEEKRSKP